MTIKRRPRKWKYKKLGRYDESVNIFVVFAKGKL